MSGVDAAKNGDRAAFESLITPHAKTLFGYIAYRVSGRADALDVFQESVLCAWRNIAAFEEKSSFKTWLYAIARMRVADHHRGALRRGAVPLEGYEAMLTAGDDIADSVEKLDVQRALGHLADGERELIYLVFEARMTYAQTASLIEIPEGTVKSRMASVKAKLKKLLSEEG